MRSISAAILLLVAGCTTPAPEIKEQRIRNGVVESYYDGAWHAPDKFEWWRDG